MVAIEAATRAAGCYNIDEFRHGIERMDPAHYLGSSYFEHWLDGIARVLVEKGVVDAAELDARTRPLPGAARRARPGAPPAGTGPAAGSRRRSPDLLSHAGGPAAVRRRLGRDDAHHAPGRAHPAAPLRAGQARRDRRPPRRFTSSPTPTRTAAASSPSRLQRALRGARAVGRGRPSRTSASTSISGRATCWPPDGRAGRSARGQEPSERRRLRHLARASARVAAAREGLAGSRRGRPRHPPVRGRHRADAGRARGGAGVAGPGLPRSPARRPDGRARRLRRRPTTVLVVVENTPARHNVVVCTLCSCYPWTCWACRRPGTRCPPTARAR